MIKIKTSYTLYQFFVSFVFSLVFFLSFLMLFEVVRVISMVATTDVKILEVLSLLRDIALTIMPIALPLACFFGVTSTINTMAKDSELVAMRSMGLSYYRIFLPFLWAALILSFFAYSFSSEVVPSAHWRLRKKVKTLAQKSLTHGIQAGQFFNKIQDVTLFSEVIGDDQKDMKRVFLTFTDPRTKTEKVIFSQRGMLLNKRQESSKVETLHMHLFDGISFEHGLDDKFAEKIFFKSYLLPITQQKLSSKIIKKEIMLRNSEILNKVRKGKESYLNEGYSERDFINLNYELYNRINQFLLPFVLVLLAFTVSVRSYRSRTTAKQSPALMHILGYFITYFLVVNFVKDQTLPAWSTIVIPNSIFIFLGVKYFRRLSWHS